MTTFRIARVLGIDLRVDWSWIVIFVLMTWNLFSVFTRWHPDWSQLEDGVVAASATILFFGCVLLHELAHSIVALRYNLKVNSITLFLLGGVSNIEHEMPSPRVEFFTAIAGPLTSIALGAVFVVIASVAVGHTVEVSSAPWAAAAEFGPIATLLAWLGPINIIIGVFNLIPAFPLDGGRVLRSFIWYLTDNLTKATHWVSGLGQVVGWSFVVLGIAMSFGQQIPFFGTGLGSGLWLAFIGWFLTSSARRASIKIDFEQAYERAMAGHLVGELMRREGPMVPPDASVATLVHDHFMRAGESALPVVSEGHLLGLVTTSNIRGVLPDAWATTPIKDIMRPVATVLTTTAETSLIDAFGILAHHDVDQLPVLRGVDIVGMLRRKDVTRWLELVWRGAPANKPGTPAPLLAPPVLAHEGAHHS